MRKKCLRVFLLLAFVFCVFHPVDGVYAASSREASVRVISPADDSVQDSGRIKVKLDIDGRWSEFKYYLKNLDTGEYLNRPNNGSSKYTYTDDTSFYHKCDEGSYKLYVRVYDRSGDVADTEKAYFAVGSTEEVKYDISEPKNHAKLNQDDVTVKLDIQGNWSYIKYYLKDTDSRKYLNEDKVSDKYSVSYDDSVTFRNLPNGEYKFKAYLYDSQNNRLKYKKVYFSVSSETDGNNDVPDEDPVINDELVSYNVKNGKVIEVDPLRLYGEVVKKRGDRISGDYINGTFFNWNQTSVGNLVSDGVQLAKRADHDTIARGTFIVYKNGEVEVRNLVDVDDHARLSNVSFAIQAFNLFPLDLEAEWWGTSYYNARKRSAIGYNPSINKALVFVFTEPTTPYEMIEVMEGLGCTMGIGLDGGGSTNAIFNGERITDTNRKIHNIIRW